MSAEQILKVLGQILTQRYGCEVELKGEKKG